MLPAEYKKFTPNPLCITSRPRNRLRLRSLKAVFLTNPGTTPITILAVNSDHGLSFAGEETRTMLSEFPFLYRFTVLLKSGGSNSPWSEFWSEFPHFMGMGVVPQQFTYGVVREGVIAENFPQISAKCPQTFRRISAAFPGAIKRSFRELSAEFPQNFRRISANFPQKPFR